MQTIAKLAYMAGLMDGEGYVGIKRRLPTSRNAMKSPKYSAALSIAMTDREPIDLIAGFCDAMEQVRTRIRKTHYKTIYEFSLENDRAEKFLRQIHPYLRVKAYAASNALKLCDLRKQSRQRRTKVVGEHIMHGGPNAGCIFRVFGLSDDFIAECELLYQGGLILQPRSANGSFFPNSASRGLKWLPLV